MGKRDDILNATLKLIIKDGFENLTLAKILEESKAGSGTLYNYFSSKDDLIKELYKDLRKKISRFVLVDYDNNVSIRIRFEMFVRKYLNYCIDNLDEMNFIEQYSYFYYDSVDIAGMNDDGFYKALLSLLKEGQEQRLVRINRIELLIQIINGIVMSVAKGHNVGKFTLTDQEIQNVVNSCWDSIKA
ncbi:TetR/AcrR family transcriptional regulator [Vallitalea okinawensis]|uniref:TetR/AcrR family transcriptional regulator n=1 Tax=Vallitalea okinawensis TaxID=2078660 RepID=UPI000CFD09C3|nr:TetR/AcrR family transcriptional regulator [Vallitalea okinawensis]